MPSRFSETKNSFELFPKAIGIVALLELIRGLASLEVFFNHYLYLTDAPISLLTRLAAWAKESVIIFFVLSGYVIALSQQHRERTAREFFQARVQRIVPIYLIAFGFSLLISPSLGFFYGWPQLVGNLLFLQSYDKSLVSPIMANYPLWSLGTEFQFYALFALILFLRRPGLLMVWWWAGIAAVLLRYTGYFPQGVSGLILETLAMSPSWLLGYWVAGFRGRRALPLPQALVLFSLIPLVARSNFGTNLEPNNAYDVLKCFFLAFLIVPWLDTLATKELYPKLALSSRTWPWVVLIYVGFSLYGLTHPGAPFHAMVAYALCPIIALLVYVLLRVFLIEKGVQLQRLRSIFLTMGGCSYALYAIHYPICRWIVYLVPNRLLQIPLILLPVIFGVVLLEYVIQPRAAAWINRGWKPTSMPTVVGRLTSLFLSRRVRAAPRTPSVKKCSPRHWPGPR